MPVTPERKALKRTHKIGPKVAFVSSEVNQVSLDATLLKLSLCYESVLGLAMTLTLL